jgi:hypothetical protein
MKICSHVTELMLLVSGVTALTVCRLRSFVAFWFYQRGIYLPYDLSSYVSRTSLMLQPCSLLLTKCSPALCGPLWHVFPHVMWFFFRYVQRSQTTDKWEDILLLWCTSTIFLFGTKSLCFNLKKKMLTAGVIDRQGMLTPPWHQIPPLIYSDVRVRPFSDRFITWNRFWSESVGG